MERELVERAARGDADAFAALVHDSVDRLYAVACRTLRDADQAEDAVQQALIDIWDGLPGLRDPDRFEAWTYRLVVHACCREARRHRPPTLLRQIAMPSDIEDATTTEDPIARIASQDELEQAFRQLTPEHRTVLVLRFYVGMATTEIAEALGIPLGTVASRLHYALRDLRAACDTADRIPPLRRRWA